QLVAAVSGSPGPAGAFKLSTQATGSTRQASLANLSVEAGPSRVTGKVDYDARSSRPKINAELQAGTLDLAAFGAGSGGGGRGGGAAAGSGGGTGGGGRWSRQRMDLSALDSFDGSFSLVADALIASGTRIDKAQVKVKLLTRLDQQIGSAALDILGQKVKGVRGVTDVVNGTFSAFAGSTNTLAGDFVIRRGLLETNNVSFTNNAARTLTHGTANLSPYT